MRTYVANGCTKKKGMTAKEKVMYITLTTGQGGMQQLHHCPGKSVLSRDRIAREEQGAMASVMQQ
jgi:hypothetical protein